MSRRFWVFGLSFMGVVAIAGGATWGLRALDHPPGDPGDGDQVALGEAVYSRDCARCHGEDLSGEFGWLKKEQHQDLSEAEIERMVQSLDNVAPAHDASGTTWRHDDATLVSIIKDGPAVALSKPNSRMPGFEERLSDEEVWAVVAFLKNNWLTESDTAN